MADFVKVGTLADFPTGEIKARKVGEKRVAVVQVGGKVRAYLDICPHAGYTLSGGMANEAQVICDVHGAYFDTESGKAMSGPATDGLELFAVRLDGDDVLVDAEGPL